MLAVTSPVLGMCDVSSHPLKCCGINSPQNRLLNAPLDSQEAETAKRSRFQNCVYPERTSKQRSSLRTSGRFRCSTFSSWAFPALLIRPFPERRRSGGFLGGGGLQDILTGCQPESVRCGGESQLREASGLRRLRGYSQPASGQKRM